MSETEDFYRLEPTAGQLNGLLRRTLTRVRKLRRLSDRQARAMNELRQRVQQLERERDGWQEKASELEMQLKVSKLASRLEQESQKDELRLWLDRLIAQIDDTLSRMR